MHIPVGLGGAEQRFVYAVRTVGGYQRSETITLAVIQVVLKSVETVKWVGMAAFGAWAARGIAASFAGEETNLSVGLTASISISIVLCASLVALIDKVRRDKQDLIRLRKRQQKLEEMLEKHGIPVP